MNRDFQSGEGPSFRSFQLTARNRVGAIALAIGILLLGGVFVIFGLVLLVALAAAGTLLALGVGIYRRLTGRWPRFLAGGRSRQRTMDPTLEVFPGSARDGGRRHNDSSLPPLPP